MRVPKRRGEEERKLKQVVDHHLTPEKIEKLKKSLARALAERPSAIAETQRLAEMGDFSENVGYQVAKAHLRRLNNRITSIQERLKVAIVIERGPDAEGRIRIGSTVELELDGTARTYEIVGMAETDPTKGRISHLSPLGEALLGHKAGEELEIELGDSVRAIKIIEVR